MTFPSDGGSYIILSPIELSIRRKIEAVGKPLKDWDVQINYGIKTGCNEAFIITTEKRDELLAQCQTEEERQRTAELIRPILRGRDIKRYSYDWAGLWVICARLCEEIPTNYPTICHHLESFIGKGKLGDNSTTKVFERPWWSWMQEPSYWKDFDGPKIIYPNMTKYLPFVYDSQSYVTNQKCFIITGKYVAYLTAFFNSSLFKYCFRNCFPELQGGTRELSKIFFEEIAVHDVSEHQDELFREAVEDIQREYSREKALMIDTMLFELYDLTPQERETIGFIEIL